MDNGRELSVNRKSVQIRSITSIDYFPMITDDFIVFVEVTTDKSMPPANPISNKCLKACV